MVVLKIVELYLFFVIEQFTFSRKLLFIDDQTIEQSKPKQKRMRQTIMPNNLYTESTYVIKYSSSFLQIPPEPKTIECSLRKCIEYANETIKNIMSARHQRNIKAEITDNLTHQNLLCYDGFSWRWSESGHMLDIQENYHIMSSVVPMSELIDTIFQ